MKVIPIGFGITALVAALILPMNDLQAQGFPMFKCTGDVCTVSKKDLEDLKRFHKLVREATVRIDQTLEEQGNVIGTLQGRLAKCQAVLMERKE